MKKTSGEANLTVLTIMCLSIIVIIATPIVSSLYTNTAKRNCCQNYGAIWENNKCYSVSETGSRYEVEISKYWNSEKKSCNMN